MILKEVEEEWWVSTYTGKDSINGEGLGKEFLKKNQTKSETEFFKKSKKSETELTASVLRKDPKHTGD